MARYEKPVTLSKIVGELDGVYVGLASTLHTKEDVDKHMIKFIKGLAEKYGGNLKGIMIKEEQATHARRLYEHVKERPEVEKALEKYMG